MKDVIEKIISEIKKNIGHKDELPVFEKKAEIKRENFHEIKRKDISKDIVFIDGGNAELISAPNISLQIIRIFYSIYRNNKRARAERTEFYELTVAKGDKDRIKYKVGIFPYKGKTNLKSFVFDSMDKSICLGKKRAEISKTSDIIRRFAELSKADDLVSSLKDSIIVLDGSLEAVYPGEDVILDSLYNKAVKNKNIVCGLSKSSRLFTDKGNSLITCLNNMMPGECYYEVPDTKDNMIDMYFTRLSDKSEHLFRFDVFKEAKYSPDEVFWLLRENSRDLTFPGYPYGLIEADRHARVSNNEKRALKMIFLSKMGNFAEDMRGLSSPINAHSILDKLVNTH